MNAQDVITYGHLAIMDAIKDLPETAWETSGVCGIWSVKDIISHLASFEVVLVEVLNNLVNNTDTPLLEQWTSDEAFNDAEVDRRKNQPVQAIINEYTTAYEKASALLAEVSLEKRREVGLLTWYGDSYDLEDFLLYTFYGHKREHCAQIAVYRDQLNSVLNA